MKKPVKEPSSSRIEHDETIKKYADLHKTTLQKDKKIIITGFMLITMYLILIVLLVFSNYIQDWLDSWNLKSPPSEIIAYRKVAYYVFVILAFLDIFFILHTTFNFIKMVLQVYFPEKFLLPKILESFALEFSSICLTIIPYFLTPFEKYCNLIDAGGRKLWLFNLAIPPLEEPRKFDWLYDKIIPSAFKILGIVLVRNLIIYLLNFNIHYKYYEKRIEENTEKINILVKMTSITNATYVGDVDTVVKRFMEVVSREHSVDRSTLENFLSKEIVYKIFKYCGKNKSNINNSVNDKDNTSNVSTIGNTSTVGNATDTKSNAASTTDNTGNKISSVPSKHTTNKYDEITEDEIKEFYISTLVQQQMIVKSIEQHNKTVDSFRSVLTVLIVPACIYQLLTIISISDFEHSELLKNTYFLATFLFSMNYTFSESLKTFVNCLNFIFFVRPFDTGDLIILDNKLYKVHEINLLTSVLYDGSNHTIFPNSNLYGGNITNIRHSLIWEIEHSGVSTLESFKAGHTEMFKKINEYIESKPREFSQHAYLKRAVSGDGKKVDFTIVIKLNSAVSDIGILMERRSAFFFKLQDIFREVGLEAPK